MSRKTFIPLLFVLFFIFSAAYSLQGASFRCYLRKHPKDRSERKGTIRSQHTIDFGRILYADNGNGLAIFNVFPLKFRYAGGTVTVSDIPIRYGAFTIKVKVRLAGVKQAFWWVAKRNRVVLQLYDSHGTLLRSKSISVTASSRVDKTLTLFYNQGMETTRTYRLVIKYKKDGVIGWKSCSLNLTIRSW